MIGCKQLQLAKGTIRRDDEMIGEVSRRHLGKAVVVQRLIIDCLRCSSICLDSFNELLLVSGTSFLATLLGRKDHGDDAGVEEAHGRLWGVA